MAAARAEGTRPRSHGPRKERIPGHVRPAAAYSHSQGGFQVGQLSGDRPPQSVVVQISAMSIARKRDVQTSAISSARQGSAAQGGRDGAHSPTPQDPRLAGCVECNRHVHCTSAWDATLLQTGWFPGASRRGSSYTASARTHSTWSEVGRASCVGIAPVRWLLLRSRNWSAGSFPSAAGMLPVMLL